MSLRSRTADLRTTLTELYAPSMQKTHSCPKCRHAVSAPQYLKGRSYKCPMCAAGLTDLRDGPAAKPSGTQDVTTRARAA